MTIPFFLQKGGIFAVPILHYTMEMAAEVKRVFDLIQPDCVAVELAETMQLRHLHAASRLPDISVVVAYRASGEPLITLVEPCEGTYEGLRCAMENNKPCFCIDLDCDNIPDRLEPFPDPYAVHRIGLKDYYEACPPLPKSETDLQRELYMAKRLKELSFSYDKILFVGGLAHIQGVLDAIDNISFPELEHAPRDHVEICTLTEESCREILGECGFFSKRYEESRNGLPADRQRLIYQLYKEAAVQHGSLRNLMKFARNYALIQGQLLPNLFQILSAAKGCVDHNYAYAVWELATQYPYRRNIDNLQELDLSIEQVWGREKQIRFHMKSKNDKSSLHERFRNEKQRYRFRPPGRDTICSYPAEDIIIERFGKFLKQKGVQHVSEEKSRTIPFTTSLEDGIDVRETIRHFPEKKLYVQTSSKPQNGAGSVVVIFTEESDNYPWCATWHGEHKQESDMAFYATSLSNNVVGPGISRCEYGGFLMSYPPRRLDDIWNDPDYRDCRTKAEVLLMAAIDYSIQPFIVYVAPKPPRSLIKSYARRFGKKIVFLPLAQFSPLTLNKLRIFHVLDGHDKREIADKYVY